MLPMRFLFLSLLSASQFVANSQIPAEVFAGNKKTTFDLMFFKYFLEKEGTRLPWMFFHRTRASIDCRMTNTEYLPQFGFTEALSFQRPAFKGFAPVVLAQVLNRGIFPKAGVQYALIKPDFTFFTWLVSETLVRPSIDYFVLVRYSLRLKNGLKFFFQIESNNAFPTDPSKEFALAQRFRVGFGTGVWQLGLGLDLSQSGRTIWASSTEGGVIVRYVFQP